MGFYFKDGDDLYGVTADEDHSDYTYNHRRPHKEVLLMLAPRTTPSLSRSRSETLALRRRSTGSAVGDAPAVKKAKKELEKTRELLEEKTDEISELQELYEQTKDFGKPSQRVIGHIVWLPAIAAGTAPYGFTKDISVVKLDKARFLPNLKGNVIDLGAC